MEIFEIYFGEGKLLKIASGEEMVPGIGGLLSALGFIEEIKSPCSSRGFRWDRIRKDVLIQILPSSGHR